MGLLPCPSSLPPSLPLALPQTRPCLRIESKERGLTVRELSAVGLTRLELYGDDVSERLLKQLDGDWS